ncbi:ABC transporter substrate-binding protein [Oxalobacter vibrioformis]|uniref:ABC transporter substrate-binding protein n=1 Tax=Oxalobacter vibrioformis TaxID=933080 RepID=A0A9E9P1X7_9BURK|nr:ABC transporter substrate-binding protein [Oxalobacter vibrioformis]WAW09327.1 ABC transporter substrate-binding protein [Oxalobacter vibrioformis]
MMKTIKHSLAIVLVLLFLPPPVFAAADPGKVIHTVFEASDDGFDMVRTQNYYSGWVADAIFETLLTYDYLARPAKLVPNTAESMPQISEDGKTLTFTLRKNIFFTPDPAFKGKRRELTAADYVYSIKRLVDPANRSPSANFVTGKIAGLDELAEKAKKSGRFDYDAPVTGLYAPDRYTLKIHLSRPDSNFLFALAYGGLAAVAREVIEHYGTESRIHPVGTGPYMLAQYVPRSRVVLVANPDYRGFTWNFESSGDPGDDEIVRDMKGKEMPQVGRVEIAIVEEEQSRWLTFQEGKIAFDKLPQLAAPLVLDGDKLKPEYAAQKLRLYRMIEPEATFTTFNFRDPVVGGFSREKIALRRAIAMAYSVEDEITLLRNGQAIKAEMIVPVGVVGHDPSYRSSIGYEPELASRLLDHFGYKRQADGYRTMPDGSPLLLKIRTEASASSKIVSEIWKRGLDRIGVRVQFDVSNFADNVKDATECRLMMWGSAWHADYPEGENFLQLLYGPNAGQGNHGCYQSAAYDALYKKAMALPSGPERHALYVAMNRQMEADTAWSLHVSRVRNWLVRPWVKGFKKHPILQSDWQYLDVEK